jgi:DNA helicase-2/ATP-dependent DNA helicase PcrA
MFKPRPSQKDILSYKHGTMGVSAVPGSGKTWTLSLLAAELIARSELRDDQEILIVTLVNSAVDNFSRRISTFLSHYGLIPNLGYRVRTLHGLAHDIVRERPSLVGLDSNFQIIDEREANRIRSQAAEEWLYNNPTAFDPYLDPSLDPGKKNYLLQEKLPDLAETLALQFIRTAKDSELTPDDIRAETDQIPLPLPLVEAGLEIYTKYQYSLNYRGAVDFDDLIRLAYKALKLDPDLLKRLRSQWPYILEDEAQDSSRMQEQILRLLAQNWVRVGDPNQAIYETFTTADPRFLREFIQKADFSRELPASGRSTRSVIALANHLVDWTTEHHPLPEARQALTRIHIQPTAPDDPQSNPPDQPEAVYLIQKGFTARQELVKIVKSLKRWLPENPDKTVAVLAPRNARAVSLAQMLRKEQIEPVEELLRSTSKTRKTAGALGNLLSYLSRPTSSRKLARVYKVWRRDEEEDQKAWQEVVQNARLIQNCPHPEEYLSPGTGRDWLETIEITDDQRKSLVDFREIVNRWLKTILLPIDQIIFTLAQDLFVTPTELAIAHKLAVFLRQTASDHPEWGLPELTDELAVVARNERRFISFTSDTGFHPDAYPGQVVLSTVHKAKGLEWDRVYLISVNNYNYPSGEPYDRYIAEKWYIRDALNVPAESLAQLKAAVSDQDFDWYEEGDSTAKARLDYIQERLRLLYVGITRARQELVITWNKGRHGNSQPAVPLTALWDFWAEYRAKQGKE